MEEIHWLGSPVPELLDHGLGATRPRDHTTQTICFVEPCRQYQWHTARIWPFTDIRDVQVAEFLPPHPKVKQLYPVFYVLHFVELDFEYGLSFLKFRSILMVCWIDWTCRFEYLTKSSNIHHQPFYQLNAGCIFLMHGCNKYICP